MKKKKKNVRDDEYNKAQVNLHCCAYVQTLIKKFNTNNLFRIHRPTIASMNASVLTACINLKPNAFNIANRFAKQKKMHNFERESDFTIAFYAID